MESATDLSFDPRMLRPGVRAHSRRQVRPMYSSPPMHGAHLVNRVLSNPKLKQQWLDELTHMSDRIVRARQPGHTLVLGVRIVFVVVSSAESYTLCT